MADILGVALTPIEADRDLWGVETWTENGSGGRHYVTELAGSKVEAAREVARIQATIKRPQPFK